MTTTSRPYRPKMCCEGCVFGRTYRDFRAVEHEPWCPERQSACLNRLDALLDGDDPVLLACKDGTTYRQITTGKLAGSIVQELRKRYP